MTRKTITLNQMNCFLAVAENLSFTRAAEALYKSQPAVTKQISALEMQIGVPLFYRTKRSVSLTKSGEELYSRLTKIYRDIEEAVSAVSQIDRDQISELNIGVLTGLGADDILIPFLDDFRKFYGGNVLINFETHSFKTLREKLFRGAFDAVLTLTFEFGGGSEIRTHVIKNMKAVLIMSKDDPLAGLRKLPPASTLSTRDFALISEEESQGAYEMTMRTFDLLGVTPKSLRTYPNIESVLYAIDKNKLLAIGDEAITLPGMKNVKVLPVPQSGVDLALAYMEKNKNPLLHLFVEHFIDYVTIENPGD